MATKLKPVDVVVVGVGVTGAILAKELAEAGLKVVGIERGEMRDTYPDFQMPNAHDELKYQRRHALMQDLSRETITFRNNKDETALPMRYLGSFKPGEGVGGAGVHWGDADLALFAVGFRDAQPHRRALRQEPARGGLHQPGLGRDLRRARAALRHVRARVRRLRQGRKPEGQDHSGRQSVSRARARASTRCRR